MPPTIYAKTFDGVAKDNFTLEVPESAIQQYQAASGWCDFKRIAAHHELVCRPSLACAINTEHKQTLVIDAEGEWEVASKPDWCELSQTSGNKKTEITLTIKEMSQGAADRNGEIVLRLVGKEYTHKCTVSQYNYQYAEDEWLTLQKATKGNNGGINIVILGDGYEAKEIASGQYLKDMQDEVEYFFGIEPFKTYRDYFNIYTAFPVSTESGVGSINTIRYNRRRQAFRIVFDVIPNTERLRFSAEQVKHFLRFAAGIVRSPCVGIAIYAPRQAMFSTFADEIIDASRRRLSVQRFNNDAFDASIDNIVKVNTFLPIRNINYFHHVPPNLSHINYLIDALN